MIFGAPDNRTVEGLGADFTLPAQPRLIRAFLDGCQDISFRIAGGGNDLALIERSFAIEFLFLVIGCRHQGQFGPAYGFVALWEAAIAGRIRTVLGACVQAASAGQRH
ncbi:hypothetical protein D3C81_1144360 [compost metagenome]